MNVIRFNEPFEAAIKAWPHGTDGMAINPFSKWERSPLFQYFTTRAKEKERVAEMAEGGSRLEACDWPFNTFRLSLSQHSEKPWMEKGIECGKGYYRIDAVTTKVGERVYILANVIQLYDETPETITMARRYRPLIIYMGDCYSSLDNPAAYWFKTNTFAGGRWLNGKVAGELSEGVMDSVAGFILDSMVPTNHIAEVRPDEPHRSVEWVKARSHYTLITHGHPANRRSVKHGARVRVDTSEEIRRMSGNRKGHYKQLRHPRYKYALNEKRYPDRPKGTIYVRPTWCGPREWRDEGGKQIYKILEPLPALAAA